MRVNLLFFFLFLGVLYQSLAQGLYEDCCLVYSKEVKKNVKKRVTSYRKQEQDGGCNLSAIVFRTKTGRQFCANPLEKWVQDLIIQTNKRKRTNYYKN